MKTVIALLLAMASLVTAGSAEARVRFSGIMVITGNSGSLTCSYRSVGDTVVVRFLPAGVADNGADSWLTLTYDEYVNAYVLSGGSFGSTFQTVNQIEVGVSTANVASQVKFTSQIPATIDATTQTLWITGAIKAYYDSDPQCNVTFRLAATRF